MYYETGIPPPNFFGILYSPVYCTALLLLKPIWHFGALKWTTLNVYVGFKNESKSKANYQQ